jgi:hypothetical protein
MPSSRRARGARRRHWDIAGLLVVLGLVLIIWQPPGPAVRCATSEEDATSIIDPDQRCPISSESYQELLHHRSSIKWDNVIGMVLLLVAIGFVAESYRTEEDERDRDGST